MVSIRALFVQLSALPDAAHCPSLVLWGVLLGSPFPSKGSASESSNAWTNSQSHNHWGTGLKGKFDCTP